MVNVPEAAVRRQQWGKKLRQSHFMINSSFSSKQNNKKKILNTWKFEKTENFSLVLLNETNINPLKDAAVSLTGDFNTPHTSHPIFTPVIIRFLSLHPDSLKFSSLSAASITVYYPESSVSASLPVFTALLMPTICSSNSLKSVSVTRATALSVLLSGTEELPYKYDIQTNDNTSGQITGTGNKCKNSVSY